MNFFQTSKGLLFISLPVMFVLVFSNVCGCREEKQEKVHTTTLDPRNEAQFEKEAELTFYKKNGKKIITIDIEIPETLREMTTGLMYRRTMAETEGMLFAHNKSKARFFWMKNTYIPLDMIFANEMMQIIEIKKKATPLSEELIPVPKEAQYTIEVNAGFCDTYGITAGDKILIRSLQSRTR
jgi:uncharacterized membrane protein (UPF0127 family)